MKTYKVVRRFFSEKEPVEMASGLSLAAAKAWCRQPDTSSRTARSDEAVAFTQAHGPWFDGFEEE